MFLSWRTSRGRVAWIFATVVASAFGLPLSGCGSNDLAATDDDSGEGVPGVDAEIAFEHEGTLTLTPGETASIEVVGSPPAPYAFSFQLVGDSLDASLDRSAATASADGVAEVMLRAPNSATSFWVRAKIKDGPRKDLTVAVSDQGFGGLDITPVYNGEREITEWSAFVVSGKTCESFSEAFPEDPPGALVADAEVGEPLIVDVAPVGPNLAVLVRSKHYVWGCSDVTNLLAEEITEVEVFIKDRPVDVSEAQLDMALGFQPEPAAYDALLAASLGEMLAAFYDGQPLSDALLSHMSGLSSDPSAFDQASMDQGWPTATEQQLAAVDLTTTITAWAQDGLALEPPQITGRLEAIADEPGHAIFELELIGSATPEVLGVPAEYVTTITVDPDDTARIGGTLFWLPSRYVANATSIESLAQQPAGTTMAEVLAAEVGCDQLELTGLSGCDQTCITLLCTAALEQMWTEAADASATNATYGEIPFQASGASNFDEWANLTGFQGMWLGNVLVDELSAKVTGNVIAETPTPR